MSVFLSDSLVMGPEMVLSFLCLLRTLMSSCFPFVLLETGTYPHYKSSLWFHPITVSPLSPIMPFSLFFTTQVTKLPRKALSIIWRVEVDFNGLCHTCLNGGELCTLPGDMLLLRLIHAFFFFFLSVVKPSFAGNFRTINHLLENCANGCSLCEFLVMKLGFNNVPSRSFGECYFFYVAHWTYLDLSTLQSVSCGLRHDDSLLWN